MDFAAVILAAGVGKRMKSSIPKVLHLISGRPMISYIIDEVRKISPKKIVIVVGHKSDEVTQVIGDGIDVVRQEKQLGTGHAAAMAETALKDFSGPVLVMPGDTPLITAPTLEALVKHDEDDDAGVLTAELEDPFGYGRIILKSDGTVAGIVEEDDASEEQRRINLINTGMYCFNKEELFNSLKQVSKNNHQGEYYLTDVVKIMNDNGKRIRQVKAFSSTETIGVNSRIQLAEVDEVIQDRIRKELMMNGVTFILPETSYIAGNVAIGKDTIIYPNTYLKGKTTIGEACEIGPSVKISECEIGSRATIQYSIMTGARAEDASSVGPFCYIRPGTVIRGGAKAGTYVEIKNSSIGENSKVPHLSYIGDAKIGKEVNVGAGTITCNYDGVSKWETVIEDNVFLGSDTMLIAPVKIGKGAMTGAGSAITKDIPGDGLGIERSEQRNIAGWAKRHRQKAVGKKEARKSDDEAGK